MKRRSREINVFNLSMLDVILGAMAAFLIIMVVLLPYYRKEHIEYQADNAAVRRALAVAEERAAAAERALSEAEGRRSAAEGALAAAEARADRAERGLSEAEARADAAERAADALRPRDLDLMLVMDTTGSMREQIASLQSDLKVLVRVLAELSKRLRVGLVAYRDRGAAEAYETREFPLTLMTSPAVARLESFVDALNADGGGDAPEAVDAGLAKALAQPWSQDAVGVIVVIGDAPPHQEALSLTLRQAEGFAARSDLYRLSTISAPGPAAAYFRSLAERGKGVSITGTTALLESILTSVLGDARTGE